LVPYELAVKLHAPLRRHFRDDATIEVVVQCRSRERRIEHDRRRVRESPKNERRRILNAMGRRVGERRATPVEVDGPALPRRLARYADRLMFVETLEPSGEHAEDMDTARIVTRIQAGDGELFTVLYMRYFDRVYGYTRALLGGRAEAEDVTQQVFVDVFNRLDRYEQRAQPFRAWMFVIARNQALSHLRSHRRTTTMEPSAISRLIEDARNGEDDEPIIAEIGALSWISDRDLHLFIERLPVAQREILVLRYMVGLSMGEIAGMLDLSLAAVRKHHTRALTFLRTRLASVGRSTGRPRRLGSRLLVKQSRVLRDRRFALLHPF